MCLYVASVFYECTVRACLLHEGMFECVQYCVIHVRLLLQHLFCMQTRSADNESVLKTTYLNDAVSLPTNARRVGL